VEPDREGSEVCMVTEKGDGEITVIIGKSGRVYSFFVGINNRAVLTVMRKYKEMMTHQSVQIDLLMSLL